MLVGAFDSVYSIESPTRRDLLARVGVLDRATARASGTVLDLFGGQAADDGMADLVPAGQLRDLDPAERVAAELDILGFDVSRHVLDFYGELLTGLGTVRSVDLERCHSGETVLVAGVKVATQTPAVRSGQRVIFATLDDAAGLADLVFFESVQQRCAARLFGSWLLLVRGKVRRSGAGVGEGRSADGGHPDRDRVLGHLGTRRGPPQRRNPGGPRRDGSRGRATRRGTTRREPCGRNRDVARGVFR